MFVPYSMIKEIKVDIEECAKRGEFSALWSEISKLNKGAGTFMNKEETIHRFSILNKDLIEKMEERPTKIMFRKTLAEYDSRIERLNEHIGNL